MKWSPQQEAALKAVADWYNNTTAHDSPLYRLFGFAGTGKTTLARHFAESVDGEVAFAAFTGKAASVLRAKGCYNACTIHQLIYLPQEKSKRRLRQLHDDLLGLAHKHGYDDVTNEEFKKLPDAIKIDAAIREEMEHLKQPSFSLAGDSALIHDADLIIVDECSMVDERMGQDLLSFGKKILVLGDPAQLPPVKGGGYFTNGEPDFMLTEIHRQAKDNPILHLATLVREGRSLSLGQYGDSAVIPKKDVSFDLISGHDQCLVGRNGTRHKMNKWFRHHCGYDVADAPHFGEKLVCLRNDHDIGMLNGTLWKVEECQVSGVSPWDDDARLILTLSEFGELDPYVVKDIVAFGDSFYGQGESRPWAERKEAQEYDYGYAMTCHKSQGSQWNSVLVRDESFCFRGNASQWLYTAITRAAERVTIVKD